MSTKSEPGPFDGLERAAEDEPVFTLRAHDVLAPDLIHEWVKRRREAINVADLPEDKRDLELAQCREAEDIAWSMVEWRKGAEKAKPKGKAATYSGNVSTDDEIAAKAKFDARIHAARRIDNSVAELSDAAEAIKPYGFDDQRMTIALDVASLKATAEAVRPKRRSYAHLTEGEE